MGGRILNCFILCAVWSGESLEHSKKHSQMCLLILTGWVRLEFQFNFGNVSNSGVFQLLRLRASKVDFPNITELVASFATIPYPHCADVDLPMTYKTRFTKFTSMFKDASTCMKSLPSNTKQNWNTTIAKHMCWKEFQIHLNESNEVVQN